VAAQDPNPPPWKPEYSDGCSGPILMRLLYRDDCVDHDEGYWFGGTVEDKMRLDDKLYNDMCKRKGLRGVLARNGYARLCWTGLRFGTYNYPPGHPDRSGGMYAETFNWLGPGMPKS